MRPDAVPRAARRAALGLALAASAAGLTACGDDPTGEKAGAEESTKVAVYLGVPLRGPWGPQGTAVARGVELGLADGGGGAGEVSLRLSERDTTDDDGIGVSTAGGAREAGTVLRDSGAVAAISGVSVATVREFGLLAAQTGIAAVEASGDDVPGTTADRMPTGSRSSVNLTPADAAVRRGLVARAGATGCDRPAVVDARAAGAGTPYDLSALDPVVALRVRSWTDPALRGTLQNALRGDADCLVLTGDPSAGDPASLLRVIITALGGRTVLLSRGAASQATAEVVRRSGVRAEAVVDDAVPGDTAEGRRIDDLYRRVYRTPAPVGAISGWRSITLLLRAVDAAGDRGFRRDGVVAGLLRSAVPGPPAEGRQNADGTITEPALSVAQAQPYGWRAVEALDPAG